MSVTRLEYRDTKVPKAVCVYTIAQESRYLIIENLSTMGKVIDFMRHCQQFGQVEKYQHLDTHSNSSELFDVLLLTFDLVSSARYAKRKLDNKPYDHNLLRANYAPEYETAEDIRAKFQDRLISVTKRLKPQYHNHKKRKEDNQIKNNTDFYGPLKKQHNVHNESRKDTTLQVETKASKRRRI